MRGYLPKVGQVVFLFINKEGGKRQDLCHKQKAGQKAVKTITNVKKERWHATLREV